MMEQNSLSRESLLETPDRRRKKIGNRSPSAGQWPSIECSPVTGLQSACWYNGQAKFGIHRRTKLPRMAATKIGLAIFLAIWCFSCTFE